MTFKAENDLELATYHRELNSRVDPLNLAIRNGRLDKAFLIAMEMEDAARRIQRRLNDLKYHTE